jgi:hypothetical protein
MPAHAASWNLQPVPILPLLNLGYNSAAMCVLRGMDLRSAGFSGAGFSLFYSRVPCHTLGGNLKIALNIVGALLVLIGTIWFLQGINVLPGSFMTGQTRWAVRGGIVAVAGIVALVLANRKRQSAA